jgi:hypothetical protein
MTALAQYLELEEKLKELIAQGKGDSEEADEIRDQMDEPWYALTPEERDWLESVH